MRAGRGRRLGVGAIALAVLAACSSPAPTTPPTPTPKPPVRSASPAASPTATPTPPVVATLAPASPGAPAAVLAGRVLAPRALVLAAGGLISDKGGGLISDNGGAIVANNGSNIISDNGGSYRLAAADDVPLAGVPVRLYDGQGAAILGPDGQAVVAVTDADGRYAFAGARPARHLVVKAALPKVGDLTRIVAPGVSDAPLDLASTLASAYILGRYVDPQPDPLTTISRLPADVEAETVLIAGAAAASEAPPLALGRTELAARVDALRAKSPALDAQLEKVKRLLIVAGVSNLGDGLPGTEVALGQVRALAVDAQGQVYVNDWGNKTIWQLGTDGKLRAVAGRPLTGDAAAVLGEEALSRDGWPDGMHLDALGRLVLAGGTPIVRRFTPGKPVVERLDAGDLLVTAATSLPDGSILAFGKAVAGGGDPWQVRKLAAGQAPATLLGIKQSFGFNLAGVAAERDGKVLVFQDSMAREAYRYDPASGAFAKVLGWDGAAVTGLALDPTGRLFYVDGAGKTRERQGDGSADPLAPGQAPLQNIVADTVVAATADALYAVYMDPYKQTRSLLRKYVGETATLVAGKPEAATTGDGPTALVRPAGFTVEADGTLIAADDGALVRRAPGGGATTILAKGQLLAAAGTVAAGLEPTYVRPAAGGGWWVVAAPTGLVLSVPSHLNHVAADGTVTYVAKALGGVADLLPLPDGRAWAAEYVNDIMKAPLVRVVEIAADRTTKTIHEGEAAGYGEIAIGRDAAGALKVGKPGDLLPRVVDGAGRIYQVKQDGAVVTIVRGATIVAGPGGRHFSGTGVDDGIKGAADLQLAPTGDLYFLDTPNKQIKRIPAADL